MTTANISCIGSKNQLLQRASQLISLIVFLIATFASFLFITPQDAQSHPYYNSSEPGCDGTDPNVLFCEDFETPDIVGGHWYGEDCDTAKSNGGFASRTKGWCGTIFANPITPVGAASRNGVATSWAGDHGVLDGVRNDRNMADHGFAPNFSTYNEIYVRWYQKWSTGYKFGAEKILSFNVTPGSGGIMFGNFHANCGGNSDPTGLTALIEWQGKGAQGCHSALTITGGKYYMFEIHAKTNAGASNALEIWINDCGPTGQSCPTTPTLRLSRPGWSWPAGQFGSLWFENWANPTSQGQTWVDNIKVSRVGPIGFMGATVGGGGDITPPAAPSNLQIQ